MTPWIMTLGGMYHIWAVVDGGKDKRRLNIEKCGVFVKFQVLVYASRAIVLQEVMVRR